MKKIIILLIFLLLITACGKQEAPKQAVPERPETFYVPPPKPVKPTPRPMPSPGPAPLPDIPEPVKDVVPDLPPPAPEPVQVSGRPSCKVLTKTGQQYTYKDVEKGEISMQDFSDLKKCYPYFSEEQANTEAVCCIL
ncbi:hypothetical protein GF343_04615 [Candidatus Woesearchaeota archaeon]|nr:hypothetical protein [Candidatus Woesearchaeota archaeon]